ncbi:MAG: T9SS type A sorting domain-containing protein [Saprospiraceae bacterium]|nr:T9SS type A sorting domain-containing protein [Saprospiraceae bacterium]
MKKIIICILLFSSFNCWGQRKAQFEMSFYFQDASGNKDTIVFRADSSIIDEITFDDDWNPEWGEIIDNSPFDSTFEVRAQPKFAIGGDFYQNIILTANDVDQPDGCIVPNPLLIFVYTKNWPVTMTWDRSYFRNHPCLYGSVGSPDSYYSQKWLFNDPVPIREVACLANNKTYTKDLRPELLEKNFELPFITQHIILGRGKQYITAIGIDFGPPYFHLCDSLTETNDVNSDNYSIQPTITQDKLRIISSNLDNKECFIVSSEGQIIKQLIFSDDDHIIDVSNLVSGLYLLHIRNSKGILRTKMFIKW